jgi:hypothetical protein
VTHQDHPIRTCRTGTADHEFIIAYGGHRLRFTARRLHEFIDAAVTGHAEPSATRTIRDEHGAEITLVRREFARLVKGARASWHQHAHRDGQHTCEEVP